MFRLRATEKVAHRKPADDESGERNYRAAADGEPYRIPGASKQRHSSNRQYRGRYQAHRPLKPGSDLRQQGVNDHARGKGQDDHREDDTRDGAGLHGERAVEDHSEKPDRNGYRGDRDQGEHDQKTSAHEVCRGLRFLVAATEAGRDGEGH